jgi:hypothetical protein
MAHGKKFAALPVLEPRARDVQGNRFRWTAVLRVWWCRDAGKCGCSNGIPSVNGGPQRREALD